MKKSLLSIIALAFLALPATAQTIAKGYYRVQNFASQRNIFLTDYKTKGVNVQATSFDVDALRTLGIFDRIVSDPSTVFYIENAGGTDYNLRSQGKGVFEFVGRYLTVKPVKGAPAGLYTASGIYQGVEVFLADSQPDPDDPESGGFLNTGGTNEQKWWWVKPVNVNDDTNYFGITPSVTAQGKRYAPFYAYFPFTTHAEGMKVYTVSKVDGSLAVLNQVQGTVASDMPVIIECPGADASSNRINCELQNVAKVTNVLKGEYFNSSDFYGSKAFHYNAIPCSADTMRFLGVTSQGKLGFVKDPSQKTVPRNKAFLVVSADAPDEITLVTPEEYEVEKAKDAVTIAARSYSREYGEQNPSLEFDVTSGTLSGQPTLTCEATPTSPVGTYDIIVNKGTVTNANFTGINGTLTVTKAPLTVTAKSYTIKQNEPLPAFEAEMTGFKNGETAAVLTAQPQVGCTVPESTFVPVGTYQITVSGAAAQNYDFNYVAGTLTVVEADPITLTAADATMVYGDAMPTFTFTVNGGEIEGTPAFTCETTQQSPVGTYDIVITPGTISYPNLVLVNGKLTVTPATLTASVGSYKRGQGEPNPEFVITYEGFKNGEDASVLDVAPTATCEATADSAIGSYEIIVSGGQAKNYVFNYVNGVLDVVETQGIAAVTVSFDKPADIYSADGRCIRRAATTMVGLPRGLYIVNGRKVVVR